MSCLGKLSSRLISFLKVSILSFLLTGCGKADAALETGIISTHLQDFNVQGRVVRPVKRAFARSASESTLGKLYRRALSRAIYTPVSTYGAFFATLGAYISIVHYIKIYTMDTEISGNTALISSALLVAFSIPLFFCHKPLVRMLGESAFVRGAFSCCIDFKRYTGEKRPAAIGTAFTVGSVAGLMLFFCPQWRLFVFLAAAVYLLVVFHSPEVGLFAVAFTFPFMGRGYISALVIAAFFSYTVKVLRGKRNIHFGASGLFVGLLGACFFFSWLRGGGEGALFALCMCCLYFLAANLLSTPRLIKKCVSVAAAGFGVVVLVFAVQLLNGALRGDTVWTVINNRFSVFQSSTSLASYMVMLLPIVFCKVGSGFMQRLFSYLIFVACIVYFVFTGHTALAVLAAATLTAYLAISARRVFRPLIMCFGIPVGGLYFAALPISFSGMGLYDVITGWGAAMQAATQHLLVGVGMSPASLGLVFDGDSSSMFFQLLLECGLTGGFLFVLAIVFANQRLYASLAEVGTPNRNVTAAAGAAAMAGLVLGCGTNMWANAEVCVIYWLCLGLADAAYRIRIDERRGMDEYQ